MESFVVTWWMWMLLGLALLLCEILTPGGFYVLFFGAGALVVGALNLLGISFGLAGDGLVFAVVSVAALVLFRKPLTQRFRNLTPQLPVDNLAGESCVAAEDIPAEGRGKVELRGTAWNACNLGTEPIPRAARCRVERVDGLCLYVRAE
jgi:membrane protein implicated in regulation of membrane protease activity